MSILYDESRESVEFERGLGDYLDVGENNGEVCETER